MSRANPFAGLKMSVVTGICVRHDAISAESLATYSCLASVSPGNVHLYSGVVEFPGIRHTVTCSVSTLLADPHFLASDIIVWHFGVRYDLFDALVLGNGRARQYVRYHNITPRHLVPEDAWPVIDRSVAQLDHFHHAAHVWCTSDFTRQGLLSSGIEPARVSILPLPVPADPAGRDPRSDTQGPVRIVFIGRMVASKGVLDLVHALGRVAERSRAPFRVFLAGNRNFSDPGFEAEVREAIAAGGLEDRIHWCGAIEDAEKHALLRRSDLLVIPSYHEGFCVPVVEAFGAGCFVVGYDSSNLPAISNGLARLVPTGDVEALAGALGNAIDAFAAGRSGAREPEVDCDGGARPLSAFRVDARAWAESFDFDHYRRRFLEALGALESEATAP